MRTTWPKVRLLVREGAGRHRKEAHRRRANAQPRLGLRSNLGAHSHGSPAASDRPLSAASGEEAFKQLVATHILRPLHLAEDGREGANPQTLVQRNRETVISVWSWCAEPQVRAGLPDLLVAQSTERLGKIRARKRARELQEARTSSRTK